MKAVLPFLLGGAMLATLGVLFAGVISFAVGNKTGRDSSTKLMAMRVILQGVAVALFAAVVALNVH